MDLFFNPVGEKYFGERFVITLREHSLRTFDGGQPTQGIGNMFAGPQIINTKIGA